MLTPELLVEEVQKGSSILFVCCDWDCLDEMFNRWVRPDAHKAKLCVWVSHFNISQGPAGGGQVQFCVRRHLMPKFEGCQYDHITLCPCLGHTEEENLRFKRRDN